MKMKNNLSGLLLLAASFAGHSATVGELESVQENNLLLEARLKGARMLAEMAKHNEPAQPLSVLPRGATPASPSAPVSMLTGIHGKGGVLTAELQRNGLTHELRNGNPWPGSRLTVKSITLKGVTLSDGTVIVPGQEIHYE